MGKKIKEIEIEAFRAYKEKQIFSLINEVSGDIANFAVIYAPNGYGKTSFFDAIEWLITSEIGRLNTSGAMKEEVSQEEGYILKNRESKKDHGTVGILTEDDAKLIRQTHKGRYKNDYNKQSITKEMTPNLSGLELEKQNFCTTNLLAHDKITNFLQSYTAGDKTKMLQIFWDTKGYSKILEQVDAMYIEIDNRKKTIEKDIAITEKQLGKLQYEKDLEKAVEEAIYNYNETKNSFIQFENLLKNLSDLIKHVQYLIDENQFQQNNKKNKITDIELLLEEYNVYELNFNEYIKSNKNIEIMQKKLNDLLELKKWNEKLSSALEEKQIYIEILDNWDDYIAKSELISKTEEEKKLIETQRPELQKFIIADKNALLHVYKEIKELSEKQIALEKERNQLETDAIKYFENLDFMKHKVYLIDKSKAVISCGNKKSKDATMKIHLLKNSKDIKEIKNLLSNDDLEILRKIDNVENEKQKLETIIEQLNNAYQSKVELFDKIKQINVLGKALIEEKQLTACPVCHKQYESFEKLLSQTSSLVQNNHEVKELTEKILKNKNHHEEIKSVLVQLKNVRDIRFNEIIHTLEKDVEKNDQRVRRINRKLEDWNDSYEKKQSANQIIDTKYKEFHFDQIGKEEIQIQKSKISFLIEKIIGELINKNKDKDRLLEQIQQYEDISAKMSVRLIDLNTQQSINKKEKVYIKLSTYLENKKYTLVVPQSNQLKQVLIGKQKEVMNSISDYQKQIATYDALSVENMEDLNVQNHNLLLHLQEQKVLVDSYTFRCQKMIGYNNNENIQEELLCLKLKEEKEQADLKVQNEKLTAINENSKRLSEQKIWLEKKIEIDEKKQEVEKVSEKLEKLIESKNDIQMYIVEQTNAYFKSNLINEIYQKIDPHPSMNYIDFETKIGKRGLQTFINSCDKNKKNKISPMLYLSSAQVNILSLCIFLAKVLSENNTTLNTIFIDDPIQHLDGINLLAFIDLLRTITSELNRQIIISTHNEQFYKLLKIKMDDRYYQSKFIELNSVGEVKKIKN
ncbi:AAA family ATPase [Lacrimispora algidixylanolytica]|uniref:Nuclease SbcCD subunit C n=1 Tax=Lacrimispora algidixylanolytica TaxID=94868 RepID=A0A419T900_9FIRM|nr:AAA family ATPase [Lacrimispora algidixylanolytica]RKD33948.1 hypothetical protein BET01_12330 [Lacrimispora algidixylanolytica]